MLKTYNDIYIDARKKLKAAGEGTAEEINAAAAAEARLLLAYAAGKSVSDFIRDIRLYTSPDYEKKAEEVISRRVSGEPAAYIMNSWEFYGLPFIVSRDVLIPRVDTEVLVERAIELLRDTEKPRVLDLCTGSGCIGISIANKKTDARAVLADKSQAALKIAKQNALINKASLRCMCVEADALCEPAAIMSGFDMLVCNPPYIPASDIDGLDKSVKAFEPLLALDGGEDGLIFYRAVCEKWKNVLLHGAYLLFECGIGQSEAIKAIGTENGLEWLESIKDTLGIERVIVFRKK